MRPSIILNGALRTTGIENLFALISGALPLNPAELLSSDKMTGILQRVGEKADIVLIDTPPVLALTDASVLAQRVNGVLLVVAVAVGAAFWHLRGLAFGKISLRMPADWGVISLVLLAGLILALSALPEITTPQVLRLLSGVLLYYAIIHWLHSAPRTSKLISMLALAVISLSGFALISVEWAFT